MFGKINLAEFEELDMRFVPDDARVAWQTATGGLVGAAYKPITYCGNQLVNGMNYFFTAEQTIIANPPVRRLVLVVIHDNNIIHVKEIL